MFSGHRSALVASHVWLGLTGGRFQSDGGLRIAAATARGGLRLKDASVPKPACSMQTFRLRILACHRQREARS